MPRPMSFDDDTALRPRRRRAWEGEIVDGWATPRGPLGGYVMAIVDAGAWSSPSTIPSAARARRRCTSCAVPELGPVTVRATVERAGRSLTSVSAPARAGRQAARHRARRLVEARGRGRLLGEPADARGRAAPERAARSAADFPRDQPPAFIAEALDAAPLRRAAVQRRRAAARSAAGSACSSGARSTRPRSRCWPTPGSRRRGRGWPSSPRRRRSTSPSISASRCRLPTRCCSAASATGWSATASSTRTASSGRADGTLVAQSRQLGLLIGLPG